MNTYALRIIVLIYLGTVAMTENFSHIINQNRELRPVDWKRSLKIDESRKNTVTVDVEVTKELATISINGKMIFNMINSNSNSSNSLNWHHSGFFVLIIDESKGNVLSSKHFGTNQLSASISLRHYMKGIRNERIVLLVAVPEWLLFMDPETLSYLSNLGFESIHKICNGEPFIGVAIQGKRKIIAEFVFTQYASPLFRPLEAQIILKLSQNKSICGWHQNVELSLQKEFCSTYGGFKELCRCDHPFIPSKYLIDQELIQIREFIPVVIVAAKNTHFLFRLLYNLYTTPGCSQTEILIVCDGISDPILALIKLFNLAVKVHNPEGSIGSNTRINANIRFALASAFHHFNSADKIILLEDDLLVSPDFFRYFQATSWVLDNDPTVSCVNGFSYNSLPEVASDVSRILRVEAFPWYGWMVKRNYALQIILHWVREETGYDWDLWLRWEQLRRSRDVLVPEISRTFHAGNAGIHVSGAEQFLFYHRIITNQHPNPHYQPMKRLILKNYIYDLMANIRAAQNVDLDVMSADVLPKNESGPFVTFIRVGTANDEHQSFEVIQRILNTYYWDTREHFRGVMTFRIQHKVLYVVGCPLSKIFCPLNAKHPRTLNPSENLISLAVSRSNNFDEKQFKMVRRRRIHHSNITIVGSLQNYI